MSRPSLVTSTDVELLRALALERSLVGASRRLGISRDRAMYRIERLARAFGGPVVQTAKGGRHHGGSLLTPLGDRVLRGGFESVELVNARPVTPLALPNLLRGTYRRLPDPEVRVGRSLRLRVAFDADDGAPTAVLLDPEAIVVARHQFPTSARNVLRGTVEGVRPGRGGAGPTVVVRCSGRRLRVAMTPSGVRQLGLRGGVSVWLYVKATALRRVQDRGPASPERLR